MKIQYALRIVLLSITVVMSACGGNITVESGPLGLEKSGTTTDSTPAKETNRNIPDQTPVELPDTLTDSQDPEMVPTPALKAAASSRKDLVASDPNDFQLASGKVQLVEFFAFW